MTHTALITGASSGIGLATAQVFAEQGYRLIICGRRTDRLQDFQEQWGDKIDIQLLTFDVRHREEVFAAIASLPADWQDIDILINNAGNAHGLDTFQDGNLDDWEAMLDINVKGLLYVTKAILPRMLTAGRGHIINIGSIAGKETYPRGNVYCASKNAVATLNDALRIDLLGKGIRVSAIHPGLVETEFSLVRFKGDEARAATVYQGYQPLTARDVAETIAFVVSRPPHVNLAEILLLPTDQVSATLVHKELK